MKDRVPLYPGRVKLTPVSGHANTYDMVRADEPTQEGTPLSKATFLKDATAEKFGLDANAVPDDALALLSRFHKGLGNEYIWAKTKVVDTIQLDKLYGYASNVSWTVYRSPTMSESNGVFTLDQRIQVSGYGPSGFADYVGQYFDLTSIYGSATSCVKLDSCTSSIADFYTLKLVQVSTTVGYVNSPDADAYPPAEDDGYTYKALGQFGNKVQIETGSYVGTGTYGSEKPNSLTFGFEPQVLFISGKPVSWGANLPNIGQIINNKTSTECIVGFSYGSNSGTSAGGTGSPRILHGMFDNKTITWFANNEHVQLNTKGVTYEYIAIG